jgi:dynein heavy chain
MKQEVIKTFPKVRSECDKLLTASLFSTNFSKILKLDEFEQLQIQALTNIKTFLRDR